MPHCVSVQISQRHWLTGVWPYTDWNGTREAVADYDQVLQLAPESAWGHYKPRRETCRSDYEFRIRAALWT